MEKLAYTMSDRAANEKTANRLLDRWKDELLNTASGRTNKTLVPNFYCIAHVLLGFSRNIAFNHEYKNAG